MHFDLLAGDRILAIDCRLNPDRSLSIGLLYLDRFAKSPVTIDVGGISIEYNLPPHLTIQPHTNYLADFKIDERIPD